LLLCVSVCCLFFFVLFFLFMLSQLSPAHSNSLLNRYDERRRFRLACPTPIGWFGRNEIPPRLSFSERAVPVQDVIGVDALRHEHLRMMWGWGIGQSVDSAVTERLLPVLLGSSNEDEQQQDEEQDETKRWIRKLKPPSRQSVERVALIRANAESGAEDVGLPRAADRVRSLSERQNLYRSLGLIFLKTTTADEKKEEIIEEDQEEENETHFSETSSIDILDNSSTLFSYVLRNEWRKTQHKKSKEYLSEWAKSNHGTQAPSVLRLHLFQDPVNMLRCFRWSYCGTENVPVFRACMTSSSKDSVRIEGLTLQCATWSEEQNRLEPCQGEKLYQSFPSMYLISIRPFVHPEDAHLYKCPIFTRKTCKLIAYVYLRSSMEPARCSEQSIALVADPKLVN
jgi:hypothetical protein